MTPRRYKSRSEIALALVLAMVNRGWPELAIYRALMDKPNRGGAKVQELAGKGERSARRYVARLYQKALRRVRESPPTHEGADEAREAVGRLRQHADRHAWPGVGGATDRRVLKAHLDIAAQIGSESYGAADREVAERAGVGRETVMRSHVRLIRAAWLNRVGVVRGGRPSVWTLVRRQDLSPFTIRPPLPSGEGNGDRCCREYFRWSGFGSRGAGLATERVFEVLRRLGRANAKQLAAALVMSPRTVRHHLHRLRDDGIARSDTATWELVANVEEASTRAAARRGTLGSAAWQRARHREDREAYWEARREHHAVRAEVLDLARALGWRSVRLNARVLLAPGERAWRTRIEEAATKELRALRIALRVQRGTPESASERDDPHAADATAPHKKHAEAASADAPARRSTK